jgi:sugar lactone lactonase YvrE
MSNKCVAACFVGSIISLLTAACAVPNGKVAPSLVRPPASAILPDADVRDSMLLRPYQSGSVPSVLGLLYVSDLGPNDVAWYNRSRLTKGPIGTITRGVSGPDGVFVDVTGSIYVVNNVRTSNVTVYPPRGNKPSVRYTEGLHHPVDVVVGAEGTVYVANFDSGQSGTVVEYASGTTTASKILRPGGSVYGLALDARNRLYVAYQSSRFGAIKQYLFGSTVGRLLPAKIGIPGGIQIDLDGNIVVCDQGFASVKVFRPDSPSPSSVYQLNSPYRIALAPHNHRLYITQPFLSGSRRGQAHANFAGDFGAALRDSPSQSQLTVLEYPSGTLIANITGVVNFPLGVAATDE